MIRVRSMVRDQDINHSRAYGLPQGQYIVFRAQGRVDPHTGIIPLHQGFIPEQIVGASLGSDGNTALLGPSVRIQTGSGFVK